MGGGFVPATARPLAWQRAKRRLHLPIPTSTPRLTRRHVVCTHRITRITDSTAVPACHHPTLGAPRSDPIDTILLAVTTTWDRAETSPMRHLNLAPMIPAQATITTITIRTRTTPQMIPDEVAALVVPGHHLRRAGVRPVVGKGRRGLGSCASVSPCFVIVLCWIAPRIDCRKGEPGHPPANRSCWGTQATGIGRAKGTAGICQAVPGRRWGERR